MTNDMIREQSDRLMAVLGAYAQRAGITAPDMCAIALAAAMGISANLRGPVGAIEHLRDVADEAEGTILSSMMQH